MTQSQLTLAVLELRNFPLPLRIDISDGWTEQVSGMADATSTIRREYRSEAHPEAILCVLYRDVELQAADSAAMVATFAKPPHQLWPGDIDAIRGALGDMGNPEVFELAGARTSCVGGRDALVVEGRWKQTGKETYDAFVPLTPECKRLQEIYFVAPGDVFQRQIQYIKSAIATVRWFSNE
jgi:hypothetical protein